jgi:hypothetical protein
MGNTELEWLIHHPEVEEQFAGEYLAIHLDQIIAHGKDLHEVLIAANLKNTTFIIHKAASSNKELVV